MYDNLKNKTVYIYTLGCKVNQYESDAMYENLEKYGCIALHEYKDSEADICIINTCSVTSMADKKSRQIISRMRKQSPNSVIVATGCYVQASAEEIIKNGVVDVIIGNNRKKDAARIISEYMEYGRSSDNFIDVNKDPEFEDLRIKMPEGHTRAYIKIQDGCNNFCTYCIIPYVRGRIKSKQLTDIVDEVSTLAENGVKEIILTGINLSSYDDADTGSTLKDVICRISHISGIKRIRLSSVEPRVITKEFLEAVSALPNFCPHFHLSLQSACNDTLKRMNRKYTIEEFISVCDLIRKYYDHPALTTDVIVGFPGETDKEFETTYENLKLINFYEMHVFKYSRRKGTVAFSMPDQVPEEIKNLRSNRLLELSDANKKAYEEYFKNKPKEVLIEEKIHTSAGTMFRGHTERYILTDISADYINDKYPDIIDPVNQIVTYE